MKRYAVYLCYAMLFTSSLCALEPSDRQAIERIVDNITEAWNNKGAHGFADDYAEDAQFVNIFGMEFSGKEEIETRHIQILQSFLQGSLFEVTDLKLREAVPDVVIALVYWKVSNVPQSPKSRLKETIKGIFTHVLVKRDGRWYISSSHNTLIAD